ncbi:uncharacterized protein SETTUDRAFT_92355, partial [Exserohilum turcica Et28A]
RVLRAAGYRKTKLTRKPRLTQEIRSVMGGPNGPSVRLLTPSIAKKAVTRLQAS